MIVKIRFNTNYPKNSDKKWRILVDGVQHLVDEVDIGCNSYTSTDKVLSDDGNEVIKYHLSTNPKSVSFLQIKKNQIKAILR